MSSTTPSSTTDPARARRGGVVESSRHRLAPPILLDCAAGSWQGAERSRNEDQYLVASVSDAVRVVHTSSTIDRFDPNDKPAAALLAVADGMGGGSRGDLASAEAMVALTEQLSVALRDGVPAERVDDDRVPGARNALRRAFAAGQRRIERASDRPPAATAGGGSTMTMGTTLTVAYLVWPVMYVAHAGDSRCYLLRSGQVTQLTRDHTVAQKMIDEGVNDLRPESRLHDVLYNALSAGDATHQPDIQRLRLADDDVVLLASDGLTNSFAMDDLARLLGRVADVQETVGRLGEQVLSAEVADDATVVVGWVRRAA